MDWKSPLFLIGPRRALPALPPLNLPNPLPRRCPLPVRSGTREHLLEHEMSLDSYIQTDPRSRNRHFSKRPKHPGRKPQAMRPPSPQFRHRPGNDLSLPQGVSGGCRQLSQAGWGQPWHLLNLMPDPQGHLSLRPVLPFE